MPKLLLNFAILAALGLLAYGVWQGRQPPPDPYFEAIKQRGVLKVGIDPSYPPFDIVRDGKVVGYDADLVRALAGGMGVTVDFTPLALDTMYDALAAGKVDMLVSALPFIYERQKDVRYSVPYYQAGQVLVVRAGEQAIASVRDLGGKKVGVELGSNADTEARRLGRTSATAMELRSTYRSPEEALNALARGDLDAAITANESAQSYMRSRSATLTVLTPPITDEPYVVAMPARATRLSDSVDATIERLRASGEQAAMMGLPTR
ncbi:MAG: substrate-binding periplasmic protein [Chloroflexia bacterium]